MSVPAPRKSPARLSLAPPHDEPAHRLAVAAMARLTRAVAELVETLEATLAEWRRKARKEPAQAFPPAKRAAE
jgi:hypothetical protein